MHYNTSLRIAFDKWISRFETLFGDKLTYISGYKGCDSNVVVKCLQCGFEFTLNAQAVRKEKYHHTDHCIQCVKNERVKQKNSTELQEKPDWLIELEQTDWDQYKKEHKFRVCPTCEITFDPDGTCRRYCSRECAAREYNRRKEILRRKRIRDNGPINYSITLSSLMRRDNDICQICLSKVSKDVDSNDNSYPSIDHIIPVSKGGTHTWDNVQLAHRGCNIRKSDGVG